MTTRFAPSPTGFLHLGHVYAARVARENGEKMRLRFEDIDHTRVRAEFYAAIEEDLSWLDIKWDNKPMRQLDRLPIYNEALAKLKALDVVYPCFCTRREIQSELKLIAEAPQEGVARLTYPGTCRHLSKAQRDAKLAEGIAPSWRIDAQKSLQLVGELSFTDQIHGEILIDPNKIADSIIARKDITTSYHIAVVVDDADQNIDLVTRGEDLLDSTHIHRVLQKLLNLPGPKYLHHALIRDSKGSRLAKRDQAQSIRSLREQGFSPEEIIKFI